MSLISYRPHSLDGYDEQISEGMQVLLIINVQLLILAVFVKQLNIDIHFS